MRRLAALALAASLATAFSPPASAAGLKECSQDGVLGEIVCKVREDGPTGEGPGRGGGPSAGPAAADILWWPVLVWEPDLGRTCIVFRREVFPGAASSQRADEAEARMQNLLVAWPLCTPDSTPPSAVPFVAREYIERVGLPVPNPQIAPGYGLAGKPAYLETRSSLTPPRFTAPTPLGPIEVDAVGIYRVDWGDGSPVSTHQVEGGSWPEGRISHTYTDVGNYTVTVSIGWRADWVAAGASGVVTDIVTNASITNFEVRQLQAVRRR